MSCTFSAVSYTHLDVYKRQLARQLLKDFDVPPTNNLRRLSMGQKKKVALVLALSLRVPLLLLDEPTNGLDIPSKSKFRQLLVQHISDEQTVLILSLIHIPRRAVHPKSSRPNFRNEKKTSLFTCI